jgi:hypothetical protein
MKITDKVKSLIRRRPPTEEELAARAETERERGKIRDEVARQMNARGASGWPSDTFEE